MRSLVSRVGKNRTIWRGGALCAGAVTLLIVLLAVCAGTATPAGAAAEYLRVPGDADTIQAAVDLAESGTEIRVQGGEYSEHVVITKSVRLSGSWNADFSLQDTQSPTILKGGSSGRVVTVFTVDVTPTVVLGSMPDAAKRQRAGRCRDADGGIGGQFCSSNDGSNDGSDDGSSGKGRDAAGAGHSRAAAGEPGGAGGCRQAAGRRTGAGAAAVTPGCCCGSCGGNRGGNRGGKCSGRV